MFSPDKEYLHRLPVTKEYPTRKACHARSEAYGHENGNRVRLERLGAVVPAPRISEWAAAFGAARVGPTHRVGLARLNRDGESPSRGVDFPLMPWSS
jgi:hypothetical protein